MFHIWPSAGLEAFLWAKLEGIPSMFSLQPLEDRSALNSLYNNKVLYFMIDNVGLIGVDVTDPKFPNVHISFWDFRLRGREGICAALCDWTMAYLNVNTLVTQMPAGSKATLLFAKRVGFKITNWYNCSVRNAENELDDLVELMYWR